MFNFKQVAKKVVKSAAKKASRNLGVVTGSNLKKAEKSLLKAKTKSSAERTLKAYNKQLSKRSKLANGAIIAGAVSGAAGSTYTANKVKKAVKKKEKSVSGKIQTGYKMVFGKLKRVGRG